MPGNRPIRPHHVQDIKNKMLEHDLRIPILVNKKFEIIDGQHTLDARRELGLDVPYRFGEKMELKDVQTLNSTALPWTNDDYADSFVELGNKHYKIYKAFRKKYELQHEAAIMLLSGRDMRQMRKLFREGGFRVADLVDAEKKAQILYELKPLTVFYRSDVFIKALLIALNRQGFVFSKFLERAKEHTAMFQYWPKIDQNLLMIEEIYNRGAIKKTPIRFGQNIKLPAEKKTGNGRVEAATL